MTIDRVEFLNDLHMVSPGLSAREFIEQSSCFVFQDGKVKTFNDEVACQKKIAGDLQGAVPSRALLDILQKLEEPSLEVRENDAGELEFRGKRKWFAVTRDADILLPVDKVEAPKEWQTLSGKFTRAIELVADCVSRDDAKFWLTCIHLHPKWIEACDQYQMLRFKLDIGLSEPVLVRGTSLKDLIPFHMDSVALTKSWIHFKNSKGLIYSCRRYSEEYPDLTPYLKLEGEKIVLPKGAGRASERASVFANDGIVQSQVEVRLAEGKIRIKGCGALGWYKEVGKALYGGPPKMFYIAPTLLQSLLEKRHDALVSDSKLMVNRGRWRYATVLSVDNGSEEQRDSDAEPADPKKGFRKKPMRREEE